MHYQSSWYFGSVLLPSISPSFFRRLLTSVFRTTSVMCDIAEWMTVSRVCMCVAVRIVKKRCAHNTSGESTLSCNTPLTTHQVQRVVWAVSQRCCWHGSLTIYLSYRHYELLVHDAAAVLLLTLHTTAYNVTYWMTVSRHFALKLRIYYAFVNLKFL